jgi:glycosyltransferase involved in cell wall biosynthesis
MSWFKRIFSEVVCRLSLIYSDRIIVISQFTSNELKEMCPELIEKTTIVYESCEENLEVSENSVKSNCRYLTVFGGGGGHKNVARLVEAFAKAAKDIPHMLVIIGSPYIDVLSTINKLDESVRVRIKITGFLPRSEVMKLLSGAELLVFPSLYEGFGLPLLEAQKLDVPVLASRYASLPEIAGDGAIFFDPLDVDDCKEKMVCMLNSSKLRECLRTAGRENVKLFSWSKTARETINVYKSSIMNI